MTTTLTEALSSLYDDLDEPLLIAEAFIHKHFSKNVTEATYKANRQVYWMPFYPIQTTRKGHTTIWEVLAMSMTGL